MMNTSLDSHCDLGGIAPYSPASQCSSALSHQALLLFRHAQYEISGLRYCSHSRWPVLTHNALNATRAPLLFVYFLAALCFIICLTAQASTAEEAPPFLHVIVSESPPYAYEESPNKWCGLTVDLWEQISKKLGYHYDYVKLAPNEVMEALHTGKCDLCIAEMAPSIEAKSLIDFTEPYLASRLLVALRNFAITQEILEFSSSLKNNGFVEIFSFMMLGLFIFSILLWLVERKNNKTHFNALLPHGVGSAFWFGAVTMTTNGYGDKVPVTFWGRSLTFVWMLAGMIFIALLTGTVISSLTITADRASLRHIEDLARYKIGIFRGSYGAKTLKLKGLPTKKFENLKEGLNALCDKKIDAFVGDSIGLQYLVSHDYPGRLRLASIPSGTIYRSIGLRPDFPQKREINNALLEITSPPEWNDRIQQWVGPMSLGH